MNLPYKKLKKLMKEVPLVTVDGVIIKNKKVLLAKRTITPFKNYWVLPGGFVDYKEKVEKAVVREVKEETGLKTKIKKLVGVYSKFGRDPRGHQITIAYTLSIKGGKLKIDEKENKELKFFDIKKLPKKIGFDHKSIIKNASKSIA